MLTIAGSTDSEIRPLSCACAGAGCIAHAANAINTVAFETNVMLSPV
jgi:hypothetical protein